MEYQNVVFPDGIGFKCRGCGNCCREQPSDVNLEEQRRIEERGFTNFLEVSGLTENRLIRRKPDGSCFFLTKDNHCAIYDVRPMVCRLAPFDVVDWDYENNLIEVDIRPETECIGIFEGNELPKETMSEAAQFFVQEMPRFSIKKRGFTDYRCQG